MILIITLLSLWKIITSLLKVPNLSCPFTVTDSDPDVKIPKVVLRKNFLVNQCLKGEGGGKGEEREMATKEEYYIWSGKDVRLWSVSGASWNVFLLFPQSKIIKNKRRTFLLMFSLAGDAPKAEKLTEEKEGGAKEEVRDCRLCSQSSCSDS